MLTIGTAVTIMAGHGHYGFKGIIEGVVDKSQFLVEEDDDLVRYVVKITAPSYDCGHTRVFIEECLIPISFFAKAIATVKE